MSANRHIMPGLEENGVDRGIIMICGWLGVLMLASDGIPSMDRLKKLLSRVVFGATAMASLGIMQFFTGLDATQYIVIPGLNTQSPYTDLLSRNQLNRPVGDGRDPLELAACWRCACRSRSTGPGSRRDGRRGRRLGPGRPDRHGPAHDRVPDADPGRPRGGAFVLLPTWPKSRRRIAYVVPALGVAGLWFARSPGPARRVPTLFLPG